MLRKTSNKYGAIKALGSSGRLYDSTAERDRAEQLQLLAMSLEIEDIHEQRRIELEPDIFFRVDFDYLEKGRRVYEEVKGVMTERFRLICNIWRLHGPGPLRILKRKNREAPFQVIRTILPN